MDTLNEKMKVVEKKGKIMNYRVIRGKCYLENTFKKVQNEPASLAKCNDKKKFIICLFVLQGKGHVDGECTCCSSRIADGSLQDVGTSHPGHLRPCCYGLLLWYSKSLIQSSN